MIRHTFLLVILSSIVASYGYSQVSMGIITTEQRFIRNAVDSTLFIVRQDYTLRNIHDPEAPEYGLGGKEYFGRAYYLAAYAGGELVVAVSEITPWDLDPNFEQFSENDSIKPVLSTVAIKGMNSNEFIPIDSSLGFRTHSGIVSAEIDFGHSSLQIKRNSLDPTGWGIFVYSTEALVNDEAAELHFKIYKIKPDFSDEGVIGEISNPTINGSLIGAIYVTESFGIGSINLEMAGVVNEENLTWGVKPIPQPTVSIELVPLESTIGEEKRIQVEFLNYRDSSPLPLLTIVDQDRQLTYETNREGVIHLICSPEDLAEGVVLHLNDQKAICIEQAGEYSVECKYESSLFFPKRQGANCN